MQIDIIPAIDVINGECVRLQQGDYSKKTSYFKDPLEVALRYEAIGTKRLHIVDLDGAKVSKPQNLKVLERITSRTSLDVQYGGGVKCDESLDMVFSSGARRAICGSIAITNPDKFELWLKKYGHSSMILGADALNGRVAINGWGEFSDMSVEEIISRFTPFALSQVICTDISKDGMLQGPSFELYKSLHEQFPNIDITVSGGIRDVGDLVRLNNLGFRSVVVGKALYENKITLKELEKCLQNE